MESLVRKEANEAIDLLEVALLRRYPKVDPPVNNTFLPGLYLREIFMAAGNKYTSKIHKIRHPYFVMKGSARVWIDGTGWQIIEAPYFGITEPGTRRVLDILEDCFWICVHSNPDDTEDMELIEERLIEKHENKLLKNI